VRRHVTRTQAGSFGFHDDPANEQEMNVIKAFFKALKIKFEVSNESPYDPKFVKKVLQGKKEIEHGKGISLSMEELNDLCK